MTNYVGKVVKWRNSYCAFYYTALTHISINGSKKFPYHMFSIQTTNIPMWKKLYLIIS